MIFFFFFSSRRRHTRFSRDWSSDVCSSDLLRGSLHGTPEGVPLQSKAVTCYRFRFKFVYHSLASTAVLLISLSTVALSMNASSNPASGKPSDQAPDIIFVNGDIYTQAKPARVQAMA